MRRTIGVAALALVAAAALALTARAENKGEAVDYKDGAVALEGYLAMPAGAPKAGVLVVPEWWGLDAYAKHRADMLAELGYAAFAVDMYGKGVLTDDPKKAGELCTPLKEDRKKMRERVNAALETFKASKAKPTKVAAIGYCFGGTTVLELARSGADVRGVVSFHGDLATPHPEETKHVKAKVLVCSGGDDAWCPDKAVAAFNEEMRKAGADWEVMMFGGANHSFTNPEADKRKIPNMGYNATADHRSWEAMKSFFDEIFSK